MQGKNNNKRNEKLNFKEKKVIPEEEEVSLGYPTLVYWINNIHARGMHH